MCSVATLELNVAAWGLRCSSRPTPIGACLRSWLRAFGALLADSMLMEIARSPREIALSGQMKFGRSIFNRLQIWVISIRSVFRSPLITHRLSLIRPGTHFDGLLSTAFMMRRRRSSVNVCVSEDGECMLTTSMAFSKLPSPVSEQANACALRHGCSMMLSLIHI